MRRPRRTSAARRRSPPADCAEAADRCYRRRQVSGVSERPWLARVGAALVVVAAFGVSAVGARAGHVGGGGGSGGAGGGPSGGSGHQRGGSPRPSGGAGGVGRVGQMLRTAGPTSGPLSLNGMWIWYVSKG